MKLLVDWLVGKRMPEIILDWNKYILIVNGIEYKYFEVNCDCWGDIPLCKIYILDGDSIISGAIERKDIIYIND